MFQFALAYLDLRVIRSQLATQFRQNEWKSRGTPAILRPVGPTLSVRKGRVLALAR